MNLPADLNGFHDVLKRRIRDQREIDDCRLDQSAEIKMAAQRAVAAREIRHIVGQTGCFCLDCLLHRKQEWRIGDVNSAIVGPRDQWQQYTWGNAERQCLYSEVSTAMITKPSLTPSISERIRVHDSKKRIWTIDRDAKFVAARIANLLLLSMKVSYVTFVAFCISLQVASGKYHTLMLSESASIFASGDNTYGALGVAGLNNTSRLSPAKVDTGSTEAGGSVKIIATSGFASFALVVLSNSESLQRPTSKDGRQNRGQLSSIERMAQGRMHSLRRGSSQAKMDFATNSVTVNHLLSWGRGDYGVLGHGDTESSAVPRILKFFNSMRVTGVSAGMHHVLVLTELDGVYAFGDGSHGKLGMGDTNPRLSPTRITSLDGLNVVHVSAGDEHSFAMTGETSFNRQVYSWGLGKNGRLGHNDELTRLKPTRVNFFRGRKVITVVAGGAHNLATSEMPQGVCVWSWGSGSYGQLGHRDTWDALVPRSVDEIRRENVRFIDAGQRHSLAISETRQLWLWGQGIHGDYEVPDPDVSSTSILYPITIELPQLSLISARAGRGRTFVWGDRAIEREKPRPFGGSAGKFPGSICWSLPEYESLTSDSFRIVYRCGPCQLDTVCVGCAHHCHIQHCLELRYSMKDTLSRHCDCFASYKQCVFTDQEE
ncbi:Regulator of chromosome condensation (RCC1)-like protein [Phytophthora palmivora]|uniref:Regulator of chromosome condensation (RCC1)-like protein n=1 Tax=Phytophthora palmivora TaxID=4796 RepID=A0A2P4YQG5_9STRA|nr:Regulator of chromosome condensation (RCC1)-like protein [Phytophthora palmivora]